MNDNQVLKTYWEGPLSKMEILSIKSFVANGHTVLVYTYDKNLKSFDSNMIVVDAAEIIPKDMRLKVKGISTIFSDLFRYTLLYKAGGWWMDLDIVLLKPVTTESPIVASLSFINDKDFEIDLNNAPLKIPKGHVLAKACVQSAESHNLENLTHAQIAGCLLRKEIFRLGLDKFIVPPEVYSPIGWGDSPRIVGPKFGFDRITESTIAIHLFGNMWSHERKQDKNGIYHPDSLYEWLKRKYSV